jgi:hypothetical protein
MFTRLVPLRTRRKSPDGKRRMRVLWRWRPCVGPIERAAARDRVLAWARCAGFDDVTIGVAGRGAFLLVKKDDDLRSWARSICLNVSLLVGADRVDGPFRSGITW